MAKLSFGCRKTTVEWTNLRLMKIERLYIHKATKHKYVLNEQYVGEYKVLLYLDLKYDKAD
jgi:hypothetical protein